MHRRVDTAARLALLGGLVATWSALGAACGQGGGESQQQASGADATSPATNGTPPAPRLHAVAIGVPGPFSDAPASVAARSREARALGLDALWWSASEACLAGEREHLRVSFEQAEAEHGTVAGTDAGAHAGHAHAVDSSPAPAGPLLVQLPERSFATGDARWTDERAHDGSHSFQVTAASLGPELRPFVTELRVPGPGYRRPLAGGPRVSLALWVDGAGDDGLAWIELRLSRHPLAAGAPTSASTAEEASTAAPAEHASDDETWATAEAPAVPTTTIALRYVLGGDGELRAPRRERGEDEEVLWVPRAHREREWTRLELDPLADVARGFPELDPADNALTALWLGIGTRRSQAVTAFLDDVRIEGGGSGQALFELQRELLARAGTEHPRPAQLQALGLATQAPHLDLLGVGADLLEELAIASDDGEDHPDASRARSAVEAAHAAGGLALFGRPLGAAPAGSEPEHDREELLAELQAEGLFGADLLEVGQRHRGGHRLRDHLWVWDRLALEGGLRPVGTGGAELALGRPWSEAENRFATWILATAPTEGLLLAGLRAGRVAFGDPFEFQGSLELSTERGQRMGQLVVSDRSAVELEIRIDGLEASDRVIVVESGQLTRYLDVEGPAFRALERLTLPPEGGFVRVESFARAGAPLVFSNPIHFLRAVPPGGLDPARGAIDLAGVRSLDLGGFCLSAARVLPDPDGGPPRVELEGTAAGGTLVLERLGEAGPEALDPSRVLLEGLRGRPSQDGTRLRLEGLAGTGRLVIGG